MLGKKIFVCCLGLILTWFMLGSTVIGGALSDPTKPDLGGRQVQGSLNSTKSREKSEKKSWKLSCIIHSSSRKLAVINGEILNVGDAFTGGKVLDIYPNSVLLSYQGKRHRLRLISEMQDTIGIAQGGNGK